MNQISSLEKEQQSNLKESGKKKLIRKKAELSNELENNNQKS